MYEVSGRRRLRECAQPLQQLWRVGMIAELLQRGNLRAHRHFFAKDLYAFYSRLDQRAPRAFRLKADVQHKVARIGQPMNQVMLYAPSGNHAARRYDDARISRLIDLLRLHRRAVEEQALEFTG